MYRVLSVGLLLVAVTGGTIAAQAQPKVAAQAQPKAAAQAQPKARVTHTNVLCKPYQHIKTRSKKGPQYIIRNDNFGHKRECLKNRGNGPNFMVTRSGATVRHAEPVAYPNIFYGCSWGICTAHSGLPRRIGEVRSLVTSWSIRRHVSGTWGAGYDIWFDRGRRTTGQSKGAELMIWLDSRGFPPNRWPIVVVDHVRYHLAHWMTGSHGKRWNYIQFRRVHSAAHVTNIKVESFIRVAEHYGYIKPHWWLTSVEAGFEIWKGGVGLGTKSFSVRMQHRPHGHHKHR